jgi:hypothetical protein
MNGIAQYNLFSFNILVKVKQSLYTPWRRLGERRYSSYSCTTSAVAYIKYNRLWSEGDVTINKNKGIYKR